MKKYAILALVFAQLLLFIATALLLPLLSFPPVETAKSIFQRPCVIFSNFCLLFSFICAVWGRRRNEILNRTFTYFESVKRNSSQSMKTLHHFKKNMLYLWGINKLLKKG
ncbi:hypothetical protein [Ligilactobacillus faecis]|uniref:hypothetical protein n=1 Tax=Ligilactobacillus faecis TaxID=762833 RepID=UPI0024690970|nr:hypothetical protein [Ligilactobacillus faecis]WGN90490.1 hypothetical protein QFX10_05375 [Ligilactobacillus faecis]